MIAGAAPPACGAAGLPDHAHPHPGGRGRVRHNVRTRRLEGDPGIRETKNVIEKK